MKKVILILIDSLMSNDLENIVTTGKAPALKFLFEHGLYQSECITAFPTMTASVDASLMTGVYPNEHKIPGLIWYKSDEKRLVNYVNGTKTVLKLGVTQTAKDVLQNLNGKHLSKKVKTIFEELTDNGKTSASVNFIIHRGRTKHQLKLPFMLNLTTKFFFNRKEISGPELLSIGALHKPRLTNRRIPWGLNQTFLNSFGINDSFAAQVTKFIISSGNQPDFLAIYLPDHDHYLHKKINRPLESIKKVDVKIKVILDSFGTWEKAIEQNVFIIVGDHGQTKIGSENNHNIDLDGLLNKFKIVKVGKKVSEEDEVIIANNERMAYIYPLQNGKLDELKKILLRDTRIDLLAWKNKEKVIVENYNGLSLSLKKGGKYTDIYNTNWHVEGDFSLLDLKVADNNLSYGEYPDGLSRLYGALYSQKEEVLVISAKPDYEFASQSFPTHLGGGSHGSLHYIDSIIPLLIVGTEKEPNGNLRIIDLKDYILQLLSASSTTTG